MPPRLPALLRLPTFTIPSSVPISPFLLPFLHTQQRASSILSNLSDTPGAYSKRIRRGHGPSSGKGKTSGRGHKGQKQHGKVPRGFNGGQTTDEVVHGVRGFKNNFTVDMKPVNLQKIQEWVQQGRIDPSRPITVKELRESRCVTNIKDGVKLLAKGSEQLEVPLNVVISRASTKAIAAIEAAGGSVTTRYYTRFAIQRIMRGKMNPIHSLQSQIFVGQELASKSFQNRLPDPTGRKDIEYYRDPAHRGYLSHLVPEGHGPSLFFKTPGTAGAVTKKIIGARKGGSADRLW